MEDFQIGGKITISENEKYIIVDIIEYKDNKYYFCCTAIKPITPAVFEKVEIDGETYIKQVKDEEVIKYIASKILKE